ncbi:hypothetical protein C8Q79DRAFT_720519 [Trametes meyenii]|nr:hypothetical protein C8Q79DRAFT_720519 [Trametes meyenii]
MQLSWGARRYARSPECLSFDDFVPNSNLRTPPYPFSESIPPVPAYRRRASARCTDVHHLNARQVSRVHHLHPHSVVHQESTPYLRPTRLSPAQLRYNIRWTASWPVKEPYAWPGGDELSYPHFCRPWSSTLFWCPCIYLQLSTWRPFVAGFGYRPFAARGSYLTLALREPTSRILTALPPHHVSIRTDNLFNPETQSIIVFTRTYLGSRKQPQWKLSSSIVTQRTTSADAAHEAAAAPLLHSIRASRPLSGPTRGKHQRSRKPR